MNREKLLETLRQLYRENKMDELRRAFLLGAFLLTPADREKINLALYGKTNDRGKKLIQEAIDKLGGRLI